MSEPLRDVQIVAKSGNSKTGPIPVTYRPERTCEPTCPLLGAGCYGTGRIFGIAEKYARDTTRAEASAKLGKVSADARYLRDRVVGDVITTADDGSLVFDIEYVEAIAEVALEHDLRPFGYSHAWRRMTADDVERTAAAGYVLNASCETVSDVEQALALGLPATIANDDVPEGTTISGKRVVTCPAQTREGTSCATCGLCAKPQRAAVVRFQIHGTAKNKARASVAARVAAEA